MQNDCEVLLMLRKVSKKFLCGILTVAMVFSSIVFTVNTQTATAASAGSYYVKLTLVVNKANNLKGTYGGFNKESNDSGGVSLLYRDTNGTGTTDKEQTWDIGNKDLNYCTSKGTKYLTATISGFPRLIYVYCDDNYAVSFSDTVQYKITKLEVGSSSSNLTTIWEGQVQAGSINNPYAASVDWDYTHKADYFGSSGSTNASTSNKSWTRPYASNMTAKFSTGSVNCPKTSSASAVTKTLTYGATDQYGVTMASSLCNVTVKSDQASNQVNSSNAVTTTNDHTGSDTVSARYGANVKGSTNSQKITATCSWSGSKAVTKEATFTLYDAMYTPTFKYYTTNEAGTTGTENTATGTSTYFGVVPTDPPSASAVTAYHTSTTHYTDGHYSLPAEGIKTDDTYTMVYTSAVHSYGEPVITAPTCTEKGKSTFTCTGCTYSYNVETPALGHTWGDWTPVGDHATHKRTCSGCNKTETADCSYSLTGSKDATCTEDGYKTYTCSVCGDSYTEVLNALGHNQSELKIGSNPENGTAGFMYYECQRCAKIFAVGQDGNLDPTQEHDTVEEVMSNANAEIPAPSFNTYVKQDYNYAARGVSLRWANEDDADTTVQATRFTASLQIPVGSQVTDFGYVYTQTKYLNGGVEPENTDNAIYGIEHFTLDNVGTAYRVYQQSVYGTASEGNGYTTHDYDGNTVYTFNLVVKIRNKNWQTHYAARAYIKYTYKGHEFIVYDNAYSSRTVYYVSQRVCSEEALEKDIVKRYFNNKVLNFIDPNAYPIIEEPLSE